MVCHSLLQWTTFCQTSLPWPNHLGWPHMAWLSFIELDTTVVLWSDWLVFCDYGVSLSALWCPLSTPTILLGFLLPRKWGISSRLIQQSAVFAPYLGRVVSSHSCPSWPCLLSNFNLLYISAYLLFKEMCQIHLSFSYCLFYRILGCYYHLCGFPWLLSW